MSFTSLLVLAAIAVWFEERAAARRKGAQHDIERASS